MTADVVLVTVDSVRRDYVEAMPFVDSHDVLTGIAAGHYTRPSLGALLSGQLRGAIESKVVRPTLAEVFAEAGYTTIGLVPSAQADPSFGFDAGFDYYDNYVSGGGNPARNRRSRFREFLGSFDFVRQIYRRIYPMEANMADLPDDEAVVETAVERFNAADGPRFLWVHLMGTHRPYGSGETAIPGAIDRKAEAAGGRHWFGSSTVTDEERQQILSAYRDALGRADDQIQRLLGGIDADDPVLAVAADHGDEFGEDGYYYHQGYRRRVADPLIRVPVVLRGIDTAGERLSLLDLAPTLAGVADAPIPEAWQGSDLRETVPDATVTVAPWNDRATVCWQDFERKLIARDADVRLRVDDETSAVSATEVSEDVETRLRSLGYTGSG